MNAKELRIGNIIRYSDGKDVVIANLGDMGFSTKDDRGLFYGSDDINDYKPILLTEEWLVKFGFELTDSNHRKITRWLLKEDYKETKHATIGINPVTEEHMLKLSNVFGYWFFKNGHHKIEYVHQLQNLYFALTGEELSCS